MTLDAVQLLGFKEEATFGVDPIDNAVTYDLIGQFVLSGNNLPVSKTKASPTYLGDSRDPSEVAMSEELIDEPVGFMPVNGLPFHMALGSTSNAGDNSTGTKTITGIESGRLPSYTWRFETGPTSPAATEKSAVGTKVKQLTAGIDTTTKLPMLAMALQLLGKETTDVTSATPGALDFPSSESDIYVWDTNGLFTWDFGGSNDLYASKLVNFQYTLVNLLRSVPLVNQPEPEYILEGDRVHALQFTLYRDGTANLLTDYLAMVASKYATADAKDLRFKVFGLTDASKYIQIDFTDVYIQECIPNLADLNREEKPVFDVSAIATSVSVEVVDNVSFSAFY
jgi:hypothetical protein